MNQNQKTQNNLEKEIFEGLQANVKGYKAETLQKYARTIAQKISVENELRTASVNGATGSVKNVLTTGVPEKETKSSGSESVSILNDIDFDSYLQTVNVDYHEVGDEFDIFDCHLDCGEAILLEGPKGCGKSLAIAKWCSLRGIPFITFDCSEETKEGHLMGRLVVKGQETPFHLGNIPRIIEICKHFGQAVIIFEELNALTNQMQKLLNPLLDWRKGAYVETISQHFSLNEGDKLLVMATMNPSSYSGVNELNDDLLSRFTCYKWDYPTMTEERKLLNTKGVPAEVVKQFLKLGQETRAAESRGDTNHSISTRELDSLFKLYRAFKGRFENPLTELINGKVKGMFKEEEEWNIIKSRVESIFGREVFNIGLKKLGDEDVEQLVEGASE